MAAKWETMRLSESQDRRVKLTTEKKKEILRKFETGKGTIRGLAREYNVSHKTIALIVDQEAKRKNDEYIKLHWRDYKPSKEEHAASARRTRSYKYRLYKKGELK
jgi:hypothetical protein